MNQLDVTRINEYSPYHVEIENEELIFETNHGIQYAVSFDPEHLPFNFGSIWQIVAVGLLPMIKI